MKNLDVQVFEKTEKGLANFVKSLKGLTAKEMKLELEVVMNTVNRSRSATVRARMNVALKALSNAEKAVKALKKAGLPVAPETAEHVETKRAELRELEAALPETQKGKKAEREAALAAELEAYEALSDEEKAALNEAKDAENTPSEDTPSA